jgi:Tfp pilus assembly protein PilW
MTLVELLITMILLVIVMSPILSIFAFTTRHWGRQVSSTTSMLQATLALDKIEKEMRSAIAFSTTTSSGKTIYSFTLPGSTDSSGNYLPVFQSNQGANVENVIGYSAGTTAGYYLSNTTGALTVSGGTALWRATYSGGTWTKDTSWSLNSASQPRYGTVQSFTITPVLDMTGYASSVQISITVSVTEGQQSDTYTLTRQVFLMNSGM